MLAGALHHHEGPLRAALRAEYGINLRDPGMSARDLADHVASLPNGCALWRATGGPRAWSEDLAEAKLHRHRLEVLAWQQGSRKRSDYPKAETPPPFAHEAQARCMREEAQAERQIRRRRERAARQASRVPPATTTDT